MNSGRISASCRSRKLAAIGRLVGQGSAIARRAALEHVQNVHVRARERAGLDDLGQQLSGPADERLALAVFVGARRLAQKAEPRVRVAHAKHGLRARAQHSSAHSVQAATSWRIRSSESIVRTAGRLLVCARARDGQRRSRAARAGRVGDVLDSGAAPASRRGLPAAHARRSSRLSSVCRAALAHGHSATCGPAHEYFRSFSRGSVPRDLVTPAGTICCRTRNDPADAAASSYDAGAIPNIHRCEGATCTARPCSARLTAFAADLPSSTMMERVRSLPPAWRPPASALRQSSASACAFIARTCHGHSTSRHRRPAERRQIEPVQLAGRKRLAIVDGTAGVTRDRVTLSDVRATTAISSWSTPAASASTMPTT